MSELTDPYPVTIIKARYQGCYEDARWAAFNAYLDEVHDAEGDDITCMNFFKYYPGPIGRGESPKHAYDDLVEKLR